MENNPALVLLVDDELNVLITLQAVLEQEGYEVRTAQTLAEARERLAVEQYHVCLMDLRLDDADGLELLEGFRSQQPDCSAIILTGFASLESAVRATRHGAYDYLMKPCDINELKMTVARGADRARLSRALRERMADLEAANAHIRAIAAKFEERGDEALRELSRKVEELEQARRELGEAYRQREQFFSMVIHELRGPLTTVNGYSQLLQRPSLRPDARDRALQAIHTQAHRLTRLLDDFADVSHLATGRFSIHPVSCDLVELAREQIELAQMGTDQHTIRLETAQEVVASVCDRDRVAQVFSNLLTNAIKYAPGGTVLVRIAVTDQHARISVRDEGPGIPQHQLEAIFDPYVRLTEGSGSGQGETKGMGLGLYITKGIIEAHGGSIAAESTPGAGALFTVVLPLVPVGTTTPL